MQRLLPLSKVCRLSGCTMHAQPFTSRWCLSRETNSREQRITLLPPKTANFIRKRKSCSKKRKRSSSRHLQFRHRPSRRRPAEQPRCRVRCPPRMWHSHNRSIDSAPPQYSTATHTTGLPTGKLQPAFPFTMSPRQRCTKPESPIELLNCRVSVSDAIARQRSCCNHVPGFNVCAGFHRRNAAHSFNCSESHSGNRNVN